MWAFFWMSPPPQMATALRTGSTGVSEVRSVSRLIAPIELPMKCAEEMPSSSQNRAMWRIRMPRPSVKSTTLADPPKPSMSGASTRYRFASAGMTFSQAISASTPNSPPCSSTTG